MRLLKLFKIIGKLTIRVFPDVVSSARANCHCRYTGSLTVIKGGGVPASGSSGIYLAIRIHCDNGCARKKKKCPDTNSTHES